MPPAISCKTTEFAPITILLPIVIFPKILPTKPMTQLSPMFTGAPQTSSSAFLPITHPDLNVQFLPILHEAFTHIRSPV